MKIGTDFSIGDTVEIINWGSCYPTHEWGEKLPKWEKGGIDEFYHSDKRYGGVIGKVIAINKEESRLIAVDIGERTVIIGIEALKLTIGDWEN